MIKNFRSCIISKSSKILLFALLLFGCKEDPKLWQITSDQQVISEYVVANPEFSEFAKILEKTGLIHLLAVRGPFTLFLPSNEVMQAYYQEQGVSSYLDFADTSLIYKLVFNHLLVKEFKSGDIGLGAIRDTNALGDYLVTEFQGSDILINKQSKIVNRDIPAANGVIHLIDKVIDPVTLSIYDLVSSNPSFKIFSEGLKLTGIKDTLSQITFPFGRKLARNRFTVLAVPDTIYNRYGINTIGDLIDRYTDSPDSITYLQNGFYRYMEYHCLGGTYYLNNFATRLYPILSSDNNISVFIAQDYQLNTDKETKLYTGFIIPECNYPAKNGTMHTVNDLLPVVEPEPTRFVFDVCSYFDIQQGDWYGKYYHRWYDGQNDLAKVKWEGDLLQYYFKDHSSPSTSDVNMDELQMFGFWWIEITVPKIMKGHYIMTGDIWSGISYDVYVDGVRTAIVTTADPNETTILGEFVWTKTEEHKVKLVATSWSTLFWDTLVFTPVLN